MNEDSISFSRLKYIGDMSLQDYIKHRINNYNFNKQEYIYIVTIENQKPTRVYVGKHIKPTFDGLTDEFVLYAAYNVLLQEYKYFMNPINYSFIRGHIDKPWTYIFIYENSVFGHLKETLSKAIKKKPVKRNRSTNSLSLSVAE